MNAKSRLGEPKVGLKTAGGPTEFLAANRRIGLIVAAQKTADALQAVSRRAFAERADDALVAEVVGQAIGDLARALAVGRWVA
jgi:hypothetical protein